MPLFPCVSDAPAATDRGGAARAPIRGLATLLIAVTAAWLAVPAAAADAPAAAPAATRSETRAADRCPGGLCSLIGRAVYAPERNLLSVAPQRLGAHVFVASAVTDCLAATPALPNQPPSLTELADAAMVVKTLAAEVGPADPLVIQAFSTQATLAWVFGRAVAVTEPLAAVRTDLSRVAATLRIDGGCLASERLEPAFQEALARLPLTPDGSMPDAAFWSPYEQFLRQHGSHLISGVQLGSRYAHWEARRAGDQGTTAQWLAKTCATLEGLESPEGSLLARCAGLANRDRGRAREWPSVSSSLVQGGRRDARVALQEGFDRGVLDDFLRQAAEADQPAALEYRPLWTALAALYRADCERQRGVGDAPACAQLQRALNLQAAYEGWLALRCATLASGNGFVYQRLVRVDPQAASGYQTWHCQQAKTGCQSHDSCHYASGPAMCFCYGADCIAPAEPVPGSNTWRNGIRGGRAGGGREGVNGSCHYVAFKGCQCNPGWGGDLPARDIYVQTPPGP